uniref:Uncharacterized protein n=1 Tax=Globisporangium ultimum (strain ATCC 200006 / CBS 805.95 / DAOM BR144) TaxID=431595 RepID=K3WW25_GLOUD
MAVGGKRQRAQQQTDVAAAKKKSKKQTQQQNADEKAIDKELKKVNDMLQKEETSQKQTWQIGKRLKKLMETYPTMATQKTIDAFFLWGTALARLASLNEDPTLAEAAADKFEEMSALSEGDDSAMGPVGYSLWASSLMIIATETRQKEVLDQALTKFQQAVEVDGGTTFETNFQFAKALKDGGDLVKFLQTGGDENEAAAIEEDGENSSFMDYYKRALALCVKLEHIYKEESAKASAERDASNADASDADDKEDGASDSDSERNYDEDDEDDDKVLLEDYAEVKLLEAILHGAIENETRTSASFDTTLALFEKALELSPGSPDALMELANYVSKKYLEHRSTLQGVEWPKVFADIEAQYKSVLADAGFDMAECHEICVRKDTKQQEEPEEEEIDERVPHLLNSLGKALASFAVGKQQQEQVASKNGKEKKKKQPAGVRSSHFTHAVEVLRSAHHFHDKLGCYPLAWLYAYPGIEDEENCRTWLETAESYGVLDDELQVADFKTMHDKEWFQRFLTPVEEIGEDEMEGEASGEEAEDQDDDESADE